nr:SAF domain-containing protein [Corynebacterium lactis]
MRPHTLRRVVGIAVLAAAVTIGTLDYLAPEAGFVRVAVTARSLQAGHTLTQADIATKDFPRDLVPSDAYREAEEVLGKTLAIPVSAGELISPTRMVGPTLADALAGQPDSKIVAVEPDETGVVSVLRAGDIVDIIAAATEKGAAAPLAHRARVVNIVDKKIVLIALPSGAAEVVAAASLSSPLTLLISG